MRAIAMLLGIVLHGILAYIPMPDQGWAVHDPQHSHAYGVFMSVIHGFRMPLFFLISGFFTAMLWRKRGLGSLLLQRLKRIGLPLFIGTFTIVPLVWVAGIWGGIQSGMVNATLPKTLSRAVRESDIDQVRELLATTDINTPDERFGATPLSMAVGRGNQEITALLLEQGADVNQRNRDGSTPLHHAVMFAHPELTKTLLDAGADATLKNRLGEVPRDLLYADGKRLMVAAGFNGIELKETSEKLTEIRRLLDTATLTEQNTKTRGDASGASEPDETDGVTQPGRVNDADGLVLLFTLFPAFHHLWFLYFLCWLVAAFALYALVAKPVKLAAPKFLIVSPACYLWLIPLTCVPQAMMGTMYENFGPDTSTGIVPMPSILAYYAVFFFFGAFYFDADDQEAKLGRWWRLTLPLSLLVIFPLGYELTTGGLGVTPEWVLQSGWTRPLGVLLQVAYVWLMSFGLMGMFRSCFPNESRTLRYISDSSYWLYLAHLPLMVAIQAMLLEWPVHSIVKFSVVFTSSTALLLLSYQWCVRYTPIGTMLNGPRTRPANIANA